MGVSKIEQLIEEIYEFVESCKMQPLSSTKVVVPKDQLYDLLDELRLRTPDEIKRYQKIISNRDVILQDAQEKANNMLAEAEAQTNALIDEHQIMQQAYYQANEVVNQATEQADRMLEQARQDADQIRLGALNYTSELLSNAEGMLSAAYNNSKNQYEGLLESLKGSLNVIASNRSELAQDEAAASAPASAYEEISHAQGKAEEEEFQFDENTFLDGVDEE
ncbi:ATPase [[Clostridium] polysaccharolyticum]|uniref:ATPase n=1 Tax=[Clostridium] polysaccharolyticum TaxID=29364 RepID=A0A1I0AZT7_9FIRM|nr:ATPase [[Clostridium] polysaccharolyticum]SES99982.1 hypothetical protein SAMN04487772_106116 [[Clostridium] polysaccharolyticum]